MIAVSAIGVRARCRSPWCRSIRTTGTPFQTLRALHSVDECGPTDHCKIEIVVEGKGKAWPFNS